MKTQVYSWRLSSDLKADLEREARDAAIAPFIGAIRGNNRRRSEMVSQLVRKKLRRHYGR